MTYPLIERLGNITGENVKLNETIRNESSDISIDSQELKSVSNVFQQMLQEVNKTMSTYNDSKNNMNANSDQNITIGSGTFSGNSKLTIEQVSTIALTSLNTTVVKSLSNSELNAKQKVLLAQAADFKFNDKGEITKAQAADRTGESSTGQSADNMCPASGGLFNVTVCNSETNRLIENLDTTQIESYLSMLNEQNTSINNQNLANICNNIVNTVSNAIDTNIKQNVGIGDIIMTDNADVALSQKASMVADLKAELENMFEEVTGASVELGSETTTDNTVDKSKETTKTSEQKGSSSSKISNILAIVGTVFGSILAVIVVIIIGVLIYKYLRKNNMAGGYIEGLTFYNQRMH